MKKHFDALKQRCYDVINHVVSFFEYALKIMVYLLYFLLILHVVHHYYYCRWMVKLFYKGARRGLQVTDLYQILKADKSEKLGDALEKNWNKEVAKAKEKGTNPSLIRALSNTFLCLYMAYGLAMFILFVGLR